MLSILLKVRLANVDLCVHISECLHIENVGYNTVGSELCKCNEQTYSRQCCNLVILRPVNVGDVFIEVWLLVWLVSYIFAHSAHWLQTSCLQWVMSWPLCNLNNIFELLECLYLSRFQSHVCASHNCRSVQSAYRSLYSTETAFLHIVDHISPVSFTVDTFVVGIQQWLTIQNYMYCWLRQICMHDSCYSLTVSVLCIVGFITMAWPSIALNLNLFWLALANVYALSLLSHTIADIPISFSETIKTLGVTLHQNLTLNKHYRVAPISTPVHSVTLGLPCRSLLPQLWAHLWCNQLGLCQLHYVWNIGI